MGGSEMRKQLECVACTQAVWNEFLFLVMVRGLLSWCMGDEFQRGFQLCCLEAYQMVEALCSFQ